MIAIIAWGESDGILWPSAIEVQQSDTTGTGPMLSDRPWIAIGVIAIKRVYTHAQ